MDPEIEIVSPAAYDKNSSRGDYVPFRRNNFACVRDLISTRRLSSHSVTQSVTQVAQQKISCGQLFSRMTWSEYTIWVEVSGQLPEQDRQLKNLNSTHT